MVTAAEVASTISSDPPSRIARRRLIARALIGNASDTENPLRQLFHFEQEMADTFAKNRLSSAIVIPVLVLIMAFALALLGSPYLALGWATIMLGAHAFALHACRRFLREGVKRATLANWKRRFVLRDFIYGLCWALFPLLFPLSENPEMANGLAIIRLAAVIVVLSVGALLSSPIPAAAVAGTLPIALCMAAVHIIDPTFFNIMIALATLGAEILFLHLTGHLYEQNAQNLAYRAEKDAIFAELEQSKAVSDEARRRAEAANMAKSQFLATMSHELRTPLNAILGFSELMRAEMLGPIDNPAYKDYLDDIHNSGQHLLKIINEILDLSRIEAGKRELREELTSLTAIAEEACALLELKARQKNINVIEVLDPGLPRIVVDEQAIRQVVLNLVSNALKFTPPGGEVTVKVGRTQAGGQYVSVRDNGPGIAEEEIPIVLSAFGQGSVSLKNAEQGTGLGIPIVQALIHLHGGNFTLRSQVGVGTEAIATLPSKRVVSPFTQDNRSWTAPQPKPVKLRKSA
ncbi:sensor histidine kinase [Faunimonas sp. B44]|uniref:sensor histidine kinase n=1 Tax=Faunimonas sp. B44 TaxID=3461493 RepID=UPI00404471B5